MATGRWKVGRNGLPEWEEGVSGPNQIDPPQQQAPIPLDTTGRNTQNDGWGRPWEQSQGQPAILPVPQSQPDMSSPYQMPSWAQNIQPSGSGYGQSIDYGGFNYQAPGYQAPAPQTSQDLSPVSGWYQQYLGRTPSQQEIQHWTSQPGNIYQYQSNIQNSPEAQAYRARPQQQQPQQAQGGGYNESALQQLIMSSGGLFGPQLQQLIQSRPDIAAGVSVIGSKGDKLQLPDGRVVDVNIGTGAGMRQASWQVGGAPGTGMTSSYMAQFNDPLTQQYERMLQSQTGLYQQQQAQMQEQAARAQQTRSATEAAVARLTQFLNQRAGQLQQPAYTGSEAEVMRTRALEPIEQDRQAAKQRALLRASQLGHGETSGTVLQALNDVDAGADQSRAAAQNQLAYRQIEEERNRQQEAQQLLTLLAQLPDATARGDLGFINYVQGLINQPGQQGLATGALLADLPVQRTQLGAQLLGLGGSPMSSFPGAMSLLQNSQQQNYLQDQNQAAYLSGLGRLIGYSFGL